MDASDHLESIVFIAVAVDDDAVSEMGRSHTGKIGDNDGFTVGTQSQTVAAIPLTSIATVSRTAIAIESRRVESIFSTS
jgi:hypothetical protein